jgi:hypothetical protein
MSRVLQGDQSALRFVAGTEAIVLVDGTLSVGPDTNEAFIDRLYEGLLGRTAERTACPTGTRRSPAWARRPWARRSWTVPNSRPVIPHRTPIRSSGDFTEACWGVTRMARALTPGGMHWRAGRRVGRWRAHSPTPRRRGSTGRASHRGGCSHTNLNAAVVREDYAAAFGRDTDTPGLAAWTGFLRSAPHRATRCGSCGLGGVPNAAWPAER